MESYIRTTGDFNADEGHEVHERLNAFLERYDSFPRVDLHARLKRTDAHANAATECVLNLHTGQERFNVIAAAFGMEEALKDALNRLKAQLDKHLELQRNVKEGTKAVGHEL